MSTKVIRSFRRARAYYYSVVVDETKTIATNGVHDGEDRVGNVREPVSGKRPPVTDRTAVADVRAFTVFGGRGEPRVVCYRCRTSRFSFRTDGGTFLRVLDFN